MKTNSTFLEQALFRASEVARAVTREMYPTEEEILEGIETVFEVHFYTPKFELEINEFA